MKQFVAGYGRADKKASDNDGDVVVEFAIAAKTGRYGRCACCGYMPCLQLIVTSGEVLHNLIISHVTKEGNNSNKYVFYV